MSQENEKQIDATNIFDEFAADEDLKQEVEKIKISRQKNSYYYLNLVNKFFGTINFLAFLAFIVLWIYIYIQKDSTMKNISYLNPVCQVFVHDLGEEYNCSSISALTKTYEQKVKNIKWEVFTTNLQLIPSIYSVYNSIFSKDITFLIDRTENKLRPLKILDVFDRLKNEFEPVSKSRIRCTNVNISSDYTLDIDCSVYTSFWDKILWYSWKYSSKDFVHWTAVSKASSFINFLEKQDSDFYIVEKPKKFSVSNIVDEVYWFTKQASFHLKLKYKNNNIYSIKK